MKLAIATELKARDGTPIKFNDKNLTVKIAIVTALDAPSQSSPIQGEEKIKRFILGTRIYAEAHEVELSIDEAALVKKLVDEAWPSPLVVAPIWQALEEAAKSPEARANGKIDKPVVEAKSGN